MTAPLVSFIIPVKNGVTHITEALQSVIAQRYRNIEVLVIDDGSTDGTADRVRAIADNRIRLLTVDNGGSGIVAALNTGIDAARGEYLARMDADDYCEPDRILRQVHFMAKQPDLVICGSFASKFDAARGTTRVPTSASHIRTFMTFSNPFIHPSVLIRKSALKQMNLRYEEGFDLAEDYRLWSQLVVQRSGINLRARLLRYRVHDQQHSVSSASRRFESVRKIQAEWLSHTGLAFTDDELSLHVSLSSDIRYLSEHPKQWGSAWRWYRKLFREISKQRVFTMSRYWLARDIGSVILRQGAYFMLAKLKLR